MLTDTFHERYFNRAIWTDHTAGDDRHNVKLYRVIAERLFPPFDWQGASIAANLQHWKNLDSKLSMELGRKNLSQTWAGSGNRTFMLSPAQIC